MSLPKVVLITGSSSGSGRATAHLFAKRGFQVIVHGSSSQEKVNKVVDECNKLSKHKSVGIVADFSNPSNGQKLVEEAMQHVNRLDALVCCAGVYARTKPDESDCIENLTLQLNVNLNSHIRTILAARKYLLDASNASIVIISSVDPERPTKNFFGYTTTSAALRGLTSAMAVELAPKVRVVSLSLGAVYTPMLAPFGYAEHDLDGINIIGRIGKTDEVANTIWYLSQEATYLTGSDVKFDGGYTLSPNEILS